MLSKNILLLGGFGFIGTNIMKYAEQYAKDFRFVVFDRFPSHMDNIHFTNVVKVYTGDFSDKYLLETIFTENQIDIVLHSLSSSVPSSSVDNVFDLQCNVIPTINLLDVMIKYNVKNMAFISSGGAIYGDAYVDEEGHGENDVLYPKSAYGVSKLAIEKYLYLYKQLYGMNSYIFRLSNPYGPYHYSQKQGVVNIALEKALKDDILEIWGEGTDSKDYIYIEDFCRVVLKLMKGEFKDYVILNVGSGTLLSVNQIADAIRDKYAKNFKTKYIKTNSLDVKSFRLNTGKLLSLLGDFEFTSFEDGLKKTYDWYQERYGK